MLRPFFFSPLSFSFKLNGRICYHSRESRVLFPLTGGDGGGLSMELWEQIQRVRCQENGNG